MWVSIFSVLVMLFATIIPEDAFARRGGGSFGGSRSGGSSFGRSSSPSRSSGSSFGRSSSGSSYNRTSVPRATPTGTSARSGSSFGGNRVDNTYMRQKYGVPRKVETYSGRDASSGLSRNYQINDYGGYSSSLMRGYMMGQVSSYMMWAPWHGAFWYSRPNYVYNDDGSVGVYPPTFNYSKIFIILIVIAIIYLIIRKRRMAKNNNYRNNYLNDTEYTNSGGKSSFD